MTFVLGVKLPDYDTFVLGVKLTNFQTLVLERKFYANASGIK